MRVSLKAPRHRLTFQSFLNQELDQHIEVTACLLLGTTVCLYIGPPITKSIADSNVADRGRVAAVIRRF